MKTLVAYSSRTGNTQKVGQAIAGALPGEVAVLPMTEVPRDVSAYDQVFLGYWADKGTANEEAVQVIRELHHPRVALFATAGVYADSDHARDVLANGAALLPEDSGLLGTWICQGKVDPELIKLMAKMFPEGHPHSMTPERVARLKEAEKHPDDADLASAAQWARSLVEGTK